MGILHFMYRVNFFGFHGKNKKDVEIWENLEFSDVGLFASEESQYHEYQC